MYAFTEKPPKMEVSHVDSLVCQCARQIAENIDITNVHQAKGKETCMQRVFIIYIIMAITLSFNKLV